MNDLKFVVKVNRADGRAPEYVRRIDRIPVHMTSNRKLALVMRRFTAEDVVKSLQTSRRGSGLVSVTATQRAGSNKRTRHLSSSVINGVLNLNRDERDWVLWETNRDSPRNRYGRPIQSESS